MELSHGDIIQKSKMQEFSSLFMTHRLNVMHAPIQMDGRADGRTDRGNT